MYPRLSAGVLLFYYSEADGCVTVRDRDSMQQERIPMDQLEDYIAARIRF